MDPYDISFHYTVLYVLAIDCRPSAWVSLQGNCGVYLYNMLPECLTSPHSLSHFVIFHLFICEASGHIFHYLFLSIYRNHCSHAPVSKMKCLRFKVSSATNRAFHKASNLAIAVTPFRLNDLTPVDIINNSCYHYNENSSRELLNYSYL